MKLALGTAQFGLNYGMFGKGVQISTQEVSDILIRAQKAGVELLDTAHAYGNAEEILGKLNAPKKFRIVSKCPKLPIHGDAAQALRAAFASTCRSLGVDSVSGYLLHDALDITRDGVWDAMQDLVASGRVERAGVSAYSYDEALRLRRNYPLTLVQLPANVLNPWYTNSEFPPEVEVHVRSAFLQGFLLSSPACLPGHFKTWKGTLQTFQQRARNLGLTPLQACLMPLLKSDAIHYVVVGVDGIGHFDSIIDSINNLDLNKSVDLGVYPEVDCSLLDPREWKTS